MGNTRSSSRRSIHSFPMHDYTERSFKEPLLDATDRQELLADRKLQRKLDGEHRSPLQEQESELDLPALIHQLNSFFAVVWPVCTTMILTSLAACYATDVQMANSMKTYMYYQDIDSSSKNVLQKSILAVCNALFVIGFIACLTFAIVLLYKFNCARLFMGYCVFYSASLLALAGSKLVLVIAGDKLHLIFDAISLGFVMFNFATVGVLSIFYQKGIPTAVEQGYLVMISVIVAWQLSQLPEWSVWMILLLLGFWDMFAVLTPMGPLKWLVKLVEEKGTPLPGLLFQADVEDSHRSSQDDTSISKSVVHPSAMEATKSRVPEPDFIRLLLAARPRQYSQDTPPLPTHILGFHHQVVAFLFDQRSTFQHRALDLSEQFSDRQRELWQRLYAYYEVRSVAAMKPYPPVALVIAAAPRRSVPAPQGDEDEDSKSIKLGLGDFIFYSVLVARAAVHSFTAFVACFACVVAGLAITMYLLARFDALPALPISIFSGVFAFLMSVQVVEPFLTSLTSFSVIAI